MSASLNDFERRIISHVEEYGCHINSVVDPNGEAPAFSYSVGFSATVDQPEVIVFGLSNDHRQSMIMLVLGRCRAGIILEDWVETNGLVLTHIVTARVVHPSQIAIDHFTAAMWFHCYRTGEQLNSVVRLVWPSAITRLFPWDSECAQEVRDTQPALYEARLA